MRIRIMMVRLRSIPRYSVYCVILPINHLDCTPYSLVMYVYGTLFRVDNISHDIVINIQELSKRTNPLRGISTKPSIEF